MVRRAREDQGKIELTNKGRRFVVVEGQTGIFDTYNRGEKAIVEGMLQAGKRGRYVSFNKSARKWEETGEQVITRKVERVEIAR